MGGWEDPKERTSHPGQRNSSSVPRWHLLLSEILRTAERGRGMRTTTMEACVAVNGLRAVHANARIGTAVFSGVAEAVAIETAPQSRDEKFHSRPHVASLD